MVAVLAGWLNEKQQRAVEFLREENRVRQQQLGKERLRLTDDQRRPSAASSDFRALDGPSQHGELLAKCDVLEREISTPLQSRAKYDEDEAKEDHRPIVTRP